MNNHTKNRHEYIGIDVFRMIASFLVVAIHTAPLSSFQETADFFLTYCVGRIGVPFFYMVTGYFVLSSYQNADYGTRIRRTEKRLLFLYIGMTVLYFPVNWYAGNLPQGPAEIVRWLLFDGTFYHLWYLPGAMIGCLLVGMLLKRNIGIGWILAITGVLYIIGLFGDSWNGAIVGIPFLENFYQAVFQMFAYTRNGIFFAPLFLALGVFLGERSKVIKMNQSKLSIWLGFSISLLLLLAEGWITKFLGWQRHNSMYLMLIPVLLHLFEGLLRVRKKARTGFPISVPVCRGIAFRDTSMWIYLLHPLWIVCIRGAAKAVGLSDVLVTNSAVFYLEVCIVSVLASYFLLYIKGTYFRAIQKNEKKEENVRNKKRRAWIEIHREYLEHNVEFFRSILPKHCALMPAVKANAYGHGALQVAKVLQELGVHDFCVASAAEGVQLRKGGIKGQILVLGYTEAMEFETLVSYQLTQTVVDEDYARKLKKFGKRLCVHVGIDTGMHRLGFDWADTSAIVEVWNYKTLKVTGVFSHLCAADSHSLRDVEFTQLQMKRFSDILKTLHELGLGGFKAHLLGSYGILNYGEACHDFARAGISLYGVKSSRCDWVKIHADLIPVLELKARVESIKELEQGESAGYGLDFTAERDSRIAVLAIGYADGVPRNISGSGYVLCSGKRAPIIGRICMDQLLVDISDAGKVLPGDEAVLIGRSGKEEIRAEDLAAWSGSISNEILSRMGGRLERIVVR